MNKFFVTLLVIGISFLALFVGNRQLTTEEPLTENERTEEEQAEPEESEDISSPPSSKEPVDARDPIKNDDEDGLPTISIIIDDLGNSFDVDKELVAISSDLTLAVMPFRDDTVQSAKHLSSFERFEILIHMPLEPMSSTEREEGMLMVDMDDEEINTLFLEALSELGPYAVGVNNHKGSKFTSNAEKMRTFLQAVKKQDLFFIDSFTIASSEGIPISEELVIQNARRDIFLDNSSDKDQIRAQLYELVELAENNGSAIAIGHSKPVTIQVLAEELPKLKNRVKVVKASNLIN